MKQSKQDSPLEALNDIKRLMERSSRYAALSGKSGIIVGVFALISTIISYTILDTNPFDQRLYTDILLTDGRMELSMLKSLLFNYGTTLIISFFVAMWLADKKAKRNQEKSWDSTAKRMLLNFSIPLLSGGLFCFLLFLRNDLDLILPCTLVFYGLALLNASRYTVDEINSLGIFLLVFGIIGSFFTNLGILLWALGFGVFHIIYGIILHYKYEK